MKPSNNNRGASPYHFPELPQGDSGIFERNCVMDQIQYFLHRHRMAPGSVSYDALTQEIFLQMERGLAGDGTSIPMLPSYVYAGGAPALGIPAAVIDAGGTNFRSALVTLTKQGPEVEALTVTPMPGTDGEATWEAFIARCADGVEPLLARTDRIGICFSFSFTPTPDGDGQVMQITKEVRISGAAGRPICTDLAAELARRGHENLRFALINDTLAVHLGVAAGAGLAPGNCMGMVCGTGSNVCCAVDSRRITKYAVPDRGAMLINTESGFFTGVAQGDFDRALDASTADPGHALSEKMVSGAYLGELCRLTLQGAAREGLFSKAGAKRILQMDTLTSNEADGLSGPLEKLSKADKAVADALINAVFDRSAKVMCCTLCAVLRLTGQGMRDVFHIGAEGSLFQKSARFRPALERHMHVYARKCLARRYEFVSCENTTLLGAACAVLL